VVTGFIPRLTGSAPVGGSATRVGSRAFAETSLMMKVYLPFVWIPETEPLPVVLYASAPRMFTDAGSVRNDASGEPTAGFRTRSIVCL